MNDINSSSRNFPSKISECGSLDHEALAASMQITFKNMGNLDRNEQKLQRNRLAAKECRRKKKEQLLKLEQLVKELREENDDLKTKYQNLMDNLVKKGITTLDLVE